MACQPVDFLRRYVLCRFSRIFCRFSISRISSGVGPCSVAGVSNLPMKLKWNSMVCGESTEPLMSRSWSDPQHRFCDAPTRILPTAWRSTRSYQRHVRYHVQPRRWLHPCTNRHVPVSCLSGQVNPYKMSSSPPLGGELLYAKRNLTSRKKSL